MEGQKSYHLILATFFQKSSLELCSWARKMEEIPWHLKQTGSLNELHDFLSDPTYDSCNLSLIRKSFANAVANANHNQIFFYSTMEFLSSNLKRYPQMTIDVVHYWTLLRERGFDSVMSFQNLMAQTWERLNGKTDFLISLSNKM